ncbi:MAG: hypothetical protein O2880_09695 [Proteobacteria bacterium]|nr:hypothetical protein [Pseudomonadota bacterium]
MTMNQSDERKDDKMNIGLSVSQRDVLQTRLRELRDTTPPREVWQKIEAQARAEGLFQARYFETVKWLAGTGIAAAVVLAVLNIPVTPMIDGGQREFSGTPSIAEVDNSGPANLNALMVRSQQIERDLRALPGQPRMVRASTAATIVHLEDQIAAIDYRLNHPAYRLTPVDAEIYWRERVRLMNSLLNLRTAQAQRMAF